SGQPGFSRNRTIERPPRRVCDSVAVQTAMFRNWKRPGRPPPSNRREKSRCREIRRERPRRAAKNRILSGLVHVPSVKARQADASQSGSTQASRLAAAAALDRRATYKEPVAASAGKSLPRVPDARRTGGCGSTITRTTVSL